MGKRRFAYLVSAFLALSFAFGALAAPADPAISVARMSGTVEVSHPKQTSGKWQAAKQGQNIGLGWKLRTGKGGKVQLTFPKNNTVILKENSVLYVDKLDAGGGGRVLTDKGGLLVQLKNALTPGSKFEVETPAALATVRGTEFAVSMAEGRASSAILFEGNVSSATSGDSEDTGLALETVDIAHEGLKMQPGGGGAGSSAGNRIAVGDVDDADNFTSGGRGASVGAPKKSFAQKVYLNPVDENGFVKRGMNSNVRSTALLGVDRAKAVGQPGDSYEEHADATADKASYGGQTGIGHPGVSEVANRDGWLESPGGIRARIKVQFHWDREGKSDETSSCWVRLVDLDGDSRPDLAIGDMDRDGLQDQIALSGGAEGIKLPKAPSGTEPMPEGRVATVDNGATAGRQRGGEGSANKVMEVRKAELRSIRGRISLGDLDGDGAPDVMLPGSEADMLLSKTGVEAEIADLNVRSQGGANLLLGKNESSIEIENSADLHKLIKDGVDNAKSSGFNNPQVENNGFAGLADLLNEGMLGDTAPEGGPTREPKPGWPFDSELFMGEADLNKVGLDIKSGPGDLWLPALAADRSDGRKTVMDRDIAVDNVRYTPPTTGQIRSSNGVPANQTTSKEISGNLFEGVTAAGAGTDDNVAPSGDPKLKKEEGGRHTPFHNKYRPQYTRVTAGDVNGDGRADVIVGDVNGDGVLDHIVLSGGETGDANLNKAFHEMSKGIIQNIRARTVGGGGGGGGGAVGNDIAIKEQGVKVVDFDGDGIDDGFYPGGDVENPEQVGMSLVEVMVATGMASALSLATMHEVRHGSLNELDEYVEQGLADQQKMLGQLQSQENMLGGLGMSDQMLSQRGGGTTPLAASLPSAKGGLVPGGFVPRPMSFNLIQISDLDGDDAPDYLVVFTSEPVAFSPAQGQTAGLAGSYDTDANSDRFGSGPRQTTSMDGSVVDQGNLRDGWNVVHVDAIQLTGDLDGDGEIEPLTGIAIGDVDRDGDMDYAVSGRVAIKTKGTGADKNRSAGGSDKDDSGDPIPEGDGVAIKTKGTGADKNRSAGGSGEDDGSDGPAAELKGIRIDMTGPRRSGILVAQGDMDGDGTPEQVMLLPTGDLDGDGVADFIVDRDPPVLGDHGIDQTHNQEGKGRQNGAIAGGDRTRPVDSPNTIDAAASMDADSDGVIDPLDPDADGDGLADITVGDLNGDGVLEHAFLHGDVDGDGRADFVVLTGFSDPKATNEERKTKHDTVKNSINNVRALVTAPTVGDLNGDGRADIVVGDFNGDGQIDNIELSSGGATTAQKTEWITSIGLPKITPKIAKESHGRVVADLDGDGKAELIVTGGTQDVPTGGELVALPGEIAESIAEDIRNGDVKEVGELSPDDAFAYTHSPAQRVVLDSAFGEAPYRANDRLRNAGPVNGWPSVFEDGSFEKAKLTDFLGRPHSGASDASAGRGGSSRKPEELVFNVVNPRAARDNHLQGAVDVMGRTVDTDTDTDGVADYLDPDDDGDGVDDVADTDVDGNGTPDAKELKLWMDKNADGTINDDEMKDLEAGFVLDGTRSQDDGVVSSFWKDARDQSFLADRASVPNVSEAKPQAPALMQNRLNRLKQDLTDAYGEPGVAGAGGGGGGGAAGRTTLTTYDDPDPNLVSFYGYEHTVEVSNADGTEILDEGQTIDVVPGEAPSPPHESGPEAGIFRDVLKGYFEQGDKPTQSKTRDDLKNEFKDGDIPDQSDFADTIDSYFNPREYDVRLIDLVARATSVQAAIEQVIAEAAAKGEKQPRPHTQGHVQVGGPAMADAGDDPMDVPREELSLVIADAVTLADAELGSLQSGARLAIKTKGTSAHRDAADGLGAEDSDPTGILIGLLEEIQTGLRAMESNLEASAAEGQPKNWDLGAEFASKGGHAQFEGGGTGLNESIGGHSGHTGDYVASNDADLVAHFDKWSELLNTLEACRNVIGVTRWPNLVLKQGLSEDQELPDMSQFDGQLDALIARATELNTTAEEAAQAMQQRAASNPMFINNGNQGEMPAGERSLDGGGIKSDYVLQRNESDLEFLRVSGEVLDGLLEVQADAASLAGVLKGMSWGGGIKHRTAGGEGPAEILIGLFGQIEGALSDLRSELAAAKKENVDLRSTLGSEGQASSSRSSMAGEYNFDFAGEFSNALQDFEKNTEAVSGYRIANIGPEAAVETALTHFDKWSELLNLLNETMSVTLQVRSRLGGLGGTVDGLEGKLGGLDAMFGAYNGRLDALVVEAHELEAEAKQVAAEQQKAGKGGGPNGQGLRTTQPAPSPRAGHAMAALSRIAEAGQALAEEEQGLVDEGNPDFAERKNGQFTAADFDYKAQSKREVAQILIGLLTEISAVMDGVKNPSSTGHSPNLDFAGELSSRANISFDPRGANSGGADGSTNQWPMVVAHFDKWSDLANTLTRARILLAVDSSGSMKGGVKPTYSGSVGQTFIATLGVKWMGPETLGQFVDPVAQLQGEAAGIRERLSALEAKLQNIGLLARSAGGGGGTGIDPTNPNLDPAAAADALEDIENVDAISWPFMTKLRALAARELAVIEAVDPNTFGDSSDEEMADGGGKAQDHNSSRSNKTGSIAAPDGGDDDGDGKAQDHNSSRSNKTASIAVPDDGDDDGDGKAQDHNSSRSNKTASSAAPDDGDDDGDGKAQDHNSSRSNKTASSAAPDDGGDEGGGKAQDHNSSRSNKTSSSQQPEIVENTKQIISVPFKMVQVEEGVAGDRGRNINWDFQGGGALRALGADPTNEGLPEHMDEWSKLMTAAGKIDASLDQLSLLMPALMKAKEKANRSVEKIEPPTFDATGYEAQLSEIELLLDGVEQRTIGAGQVIDIIAGITKLNDAATALTTSRDEFLPAVQKYANSYALYSTQKFGAIAGAHRDESVADISAKHVGLWIDELSGQSAASQEFLRQLKTIARDSLEHARVSKIDSFTIKQGTVQDDIGEMRLSAPETDPSSEDLSRLIQHYVSVMDKMSGFDAQFSQYRTEVRGWNPTQKKAIVGLAGRMDRLRIEWSRYETHDQTTQMKFLWVQTLELHEELHDIFEDFGDVVGLKVKEKANRTKCSNNLRELPPVGFDTDQGEILPADIVVPAVQNEFLPAVQSELLPAVQVWVEEVVTTDAEIRALHEGMEEMQDDIDPLISSNEELQDQLRGLIDPGDPVLGTRFENMDTDNDGLSDVAEISLGLDPMVSNDDGFIELISPEDDETFRSGEDETIEFAFEPLDTEEEIEYSLVLESSGKQFRRSNVAVREFVTLIALRQAGFTDDDGDGVIEVEWHIEGKLKRTYTDKIQFMNSQSRTFRIELPAVQHVIIDIDNASSLQRLGGDILINGSISEVNDLGEWEIRVAYDPSVLQFERGRKLGIFSTATVFFGEQAGGVIVISGSAPRTGGGISGEGEIFELQFTAIAADDTVVEGQDATLTDTTGQDIETDFGNEADLSISGGGAASVGRGAMDEKFR